MIVLLFAVLATPSLVLAAESETRAGGLPADAATSADPSIPSLAPSPSSAGALERSAEFEDSEDDALESCAPRVVALPLLLRTVVLESRVDERLGRLLGMRSRAPPAS